MKQETRWMLEGAAITIKWIALSVLFIVVMSMLAGCAHDQGVIQPRTAIPVECKEPKPARPVMPTENLAPDATLDAFAQAAEAEIERREGYEQQLVTALDACTKPIGVGK